jgi:hypothetical protein
VSSIVSSNQSRLLEQGGFYHHLYHSQFKGKLLAAV